MIEIDDSLCYSPKFLADLRGCHVNTIYRMIHDGRIKATRLGGKANPYRIIGAEVKRVIGQTQEKEQNNEELHRGN